MNLKTYDVTLTLTEDMLGTVPKNKDIYADYIASRQAQRPVTPVEVSGIGAESATVTVAEEVNSVPVDEEKGWTGFHTDDEGIFLYDYQVKGFIKEAGNVLKETVEVKALKSKIDSFLFVFPRKIRIADGPSGVFERPLRAMTAQGPRVTLTRSDVVPAGTKLKLQIKLLPHKELNEKLIRELFEYGQLQGLGQFRNGSFGRFTYEMEEVK